MFEPNYFRMIATEDDFRVNEKFSLEIEDESKSDTKTKAKTEVTDIRVPLYAWCILFISSIGVFMASVSTSALVIAFPIILVELKMSINTMMWYVAFIIRFHQI